MLIENKTGTLTGSLDAVEKITMTMDEDAMAFLMSSISTNLYANGYVATLRELVSNARDSHMRAGQTRPVEVTTPTTLNPNLIIEDWGVGLSVDDVRRMFSKFGGSDKRGRADERGGYGLGSKSPLSITSQYTFVATKDGQRATVHVTRGEDSTPVMQVLSVTEVDEHNGVRIIVPVAKAEKIQEAIDDGIFHAIAPQELVVHGQPEAVGAYHDPEKYLALDGLGWYTREASHTSQVNVMGVLYALPREVFKHRSHYIVHVPGLTNLSISTSRDSIIATPRTVHLITERLEALHQATLNHYASAIAGAQTAREALVLAQEAPDSVRYTWQGKDVPEWGVAEAFLGVAMWVATCVETESRHRRALPRYRVDHRKAFRFTRIDHRKAFRFTHTGWRYVYSENVSSTARNVNTIRNYTGEHTTTIVSNVPFSDLDMWARAALDEWDEADVAERAREARRAASRAHPRAKMSKESLSVEVLALPTGRYFPTEPQKVSDLGTKVATVLRQDFNDGYAKHHALAAVCRHMLDLGWTIVYGRSVRVPGAVTLEQAVAQAVADYEWDQAPRPTYSGAALDLRYKLDRLDVTSGMLKSAELRGLLEYRPAELPDIFVAARQFGQEDAVNKRVISGVLDFPYSSDDFPLIPLSYRCTPEHLAEYINMVTAQRPSA